MPKPQGILLIGGICFVIGFLVSETFVLSQQNHTCCGEGCPICLQIQWVHQVFKQGRYPLVHHVIPARRVVLEFFIVSLACGMSMQLSAVRLKVKMNR
ncbi:MAG: hypothetical protein LBK43_07835 [Treponema sp.]|jgi:hypothetical protein|nr:hypothetical protein [Treponema sp.]